MNHIKHIYESFDGNYYNKIPLRDYYRKKYDYEPLTDTDRSSINNKLSGYDKTGIGKDSIKIKMPDGYTNFHISKTADDWFLLVMSDIQNCDYECYECDQIDGLLKCIDDMIINDSVFGNSKMRINESKSDYYREIPISSIIEYKLEEFSDMEIYNLKKVLVGYDLRPKYINGILGICVEKKIPGGIGQRTAEIGKSVYFHISKSEDEWFILTEGNYIDQSTYTFKSYECDQIEGLLKCIDDKIINHPELKNVGVDAKRGGFLRWLKLFSGFNK